jgi:hypothetical protein
VAAYGPVGLSVLRLLVASVALGLAAPLLGVRPPRRADLPLILLCGLTGMTAYQLLLNWGEVHVPAGTASLLVSTAPVFSVLLARLFLRERLSWPTVLGSAVALAGSALIALSGGDAHYATAAWAVLAAALVQGVYHFACKPLLRRYTGLEVACYAMWTGTAVLLPFAPAALGRIGAAPLGATVSVLLLGLLPSAVGFVTWGCRAPLISGRPVSGRRGRRRCPPRRGGGSAARRGTSRPSAARPAAFPLAGPPPGAPRPAAARAGPPPPGVPRPGAPPLGVRPPGVTPRSASRAGVLPLGAARSGTTGRSGQWRSGQWRCGRRGRAARPGTRPAGSPPSGC